MFYMQNRSHFPVFLQCCRHANASNKLKGRRERELMQVFARFADMQALIFNMHNIIRLVAADMNGAARRKGKREVRTVLASETSLERNEG